MEKKDIINSILSGDKIKLNEAKNAIKSLLSINADKFKSDASNFIGNSIFEAKKSKSDNLVHIPGPHTVTHRGTETRSSGKYDVAHIEHPDGSATIVERPHSDEEFSHEHMAELVKKQGIKIHHHSIDG